MENQDRSERVEEWKSREQQLNSWIVMTREHEMRREDFFQIAVTKPLRIIMFDQDCNPFHEPLTYLWFQRIETIDYANTMSEMFWRKIFFCIPYLSRGKKERGTSFAEAAVSNYRCNESPNRATMTLTMPRWNVMCRVCARLRKFTVSFS